GAAPFLLPLTRDAVPPTGSGELIGLAQPAAGASSPLFGAERPGADPAGAAPVGAGPVCGVPPPPPSLGGRGAGRYLTVTPFSCSIASRRWSEGPCPGVVPLNLDT